MPVEENNSDLSGVKAPGFDDHKLVHISNIDQLMIVEPRELSRRLNENYFSSTGIGLTIRNFPLKIPMFDSKAEDNGKRFL